METFKEWIKRTEQDEERIIDLYTDPQSEQKAREAGVGLITWIANQTGFGRHYVNKVFKMYGLKDPITIRRTEQDEERIIDLYTDPQSEQKAREAGVGLITWIANQTGFGRHYVNKVFKMYGLKDPITTGEIRRKLWLRTKDRIMSIRQSQEFRDNARAHRMRQLTDPEYIGKYNKAMADPAYRARLSVMARKRWQDPEYRKRNPVSADFWGWLASKPETEAMHIIYKMADRFYKQDDAERIAFIKAMIAKLRQNQ